MKGFVEDLLGKLGVEKEFITTQDLKNALQLQQQLSSPKSLGEILVDQGLLTARQLNVLNAKALEKLYRYDLEFAKVAVHRELLSAESIDQARRLQELQKPKLPLYAILVAEGMLTAYQAQRVLDSLQIEEEASVASPAQANTLSSIDETVDIPEQKYREPSIKANISHQKTRRRIFVDDMRQSPSASPKTIKRKRKDPLLCLGATFAGKYNIGEFLGEGGMGAVYTGKHKFLAKKYALKILAKDTDVDDILLQRFINEGRAAASVQHPNVVQVHDVDETEDFYYIVMEYVQGDSLAKCVKQVGPLNAEDALWVIKAVAGGLSAIHAAGLIHRDIKPENILVSQNGEIKITDFGIVKNIEGDLNELTGVGTILGTPKFMAPEHITKQYPLDGRSDIYSLGATFYYLLVGKTCFQGETMHLMYQIINSEPVPPHEINSSIAPQISQAILKMMAKNPDDRYQNMQEVISALNLLPE